MSPRRFLAAAVLALAVLAAAGCGGDDKGGGGVDRSSPEAVVRSYITLVDTCTPAAAKQAMALVVQPDFDPVQEPGQNALTGEVGYEDFQRMGFCSARSERPDKRLAVRAHERLPGGQVRVFALGGDEKQCEGTGSTDGVVAVQSGGKWWVDADETESFAGERVLTEGCVEGPR